MHYGVLCYPVVCCGGLWCGVVCCGASLCIAMNCGALGTLVHFCELWSIVHCSSLYIVIHYGALRCIVVNCGAPVVFSGFLLRQNVFQTHLNKKDKPVLSLVMSLINLDRIPIL